ncbi:MAG: peptidyl-prolyl cis-trans isomerase [Gemmatimonadota bacterium]|nr:peptidyl-prolyl cis-trans isomerase [Gemmatimonadota bacterium]
MLQTMRSTAKYVWIVVVIAFVGVFLFAETSGLTDGNVTRGTSIGKVNGQAITVDSYDRAVRSITERAQRDGRALTLDDQRRAENSAFDQLVDDILLRAELNRRGIVVTDEEIRQAARSYPPPEIMQSPELQTDGQFDPEKYQRYLSSPGAGDVRLYLENYYRSEIPRQKLSEQLVTGVHVSDAQLWSIWRDQHDSAVASYVALTPELVPDSAVKVTDQEIKTYFREHRTDFRHLPGQAKVSVVKLPRVVTAADTAATRARAEALRAEITGGAKFEDVARRESVDSASAAQGGLLGRITPAEPFVEEFKKAAFALNVGEISQPVLSQFGYHVIKVDEKKGDTIAVRHLLLRVQQSDSSAAVTDKRADQLARLAGEADVPTKFDAAAKAMQLPVFTGLAIEGEPLTIAGQYVPDVSAWAFGGAKKGESSELIEADDAYFLARIDSLVEGGEPSVDNLREEISRTLMRQKKVDALLPRAERIATAVAGGKTLEEAARTSDVQVQQAEAFTRTSAVPGLGRLSEAIGAAFGLPVGAVSAPVKTRNGVYVLRVERRVQADRTAWEVQKETQRASLLDQMRRQRVQQFMVNLRQAAKISDDRDKLRQAQIQSAAG